MGPADRDWISAVPMLTVAGSLGSHVGSGRVQLVDPRWWIRRLVCLLQLYIRCVPSTHGCASLASGQRCEKKQLSSSQVSEQVHYIGPWISHHEHGWIQLGILNWEEMGKKQLILATEQNSLMLVLMCKPYIQLDSFTLLYSRHQCLGYTV